jgi:hypothetical protein
MTQADLSEDTIYPWDAQLMGKMRSYIYSTTSKSDYIKLNEWCSLILKGAAIRQINDFIAELKPQHVMEAFENDEDVGLSVDWSKPKDRWVMNISWTRDKMKRPPVPDDFPFSDDVYIGPNKHPNDEQMKKITDEVSRLIAGKLNFVNPGEGGTEGASTTTTPDASAKNASSVDVLTTKTPSSEKAPDPNPAASAPSTPAPEKVVPIVPAAGLPECPGKKKNPALEFGQHPTGMEVECMTCMLEAKCIKATSEKK